VNAGIALPPSVEPRRAAEQSRRLLESDVRPWRVLHLCCGVSEIAPVLEVQRTAGMRPLAFTQSGPAEPSTWLAGSPPASSASLLSAWREVRTWRRWIADSQGEFEIIHAHSFSGGMAAVRANAPLVYDIHRFVEQAAGALGEIAEHCWLERSFRTAEQFVLARAAAVIVHSAPAYRGALDRGCASGSVFIFPELLQTPRPELEPAWLRNLAKRYDAVYGNVLSRGRAGRGPLLPPGCQPLAACL
jgi:hypothetical protein